MHFDDPQSQTDQTTFTPEAPQRGWFARNWIWVVPLAILLPILICAGCCTGLFGFGVGALKQTEPYQEALATVQNDPQVQEELGTPIEDDTWVPAGDFNMTDDQGEARFDFQVKGPKGGAHVRTESRMIGGQWHVIELIVTIDATGERIVVDTGEGEGDEAPLWEP